MDDKDKTKEELIGEVAALRQHIAELESRLAQLERIERELRGSDQRLRNILEASPLAVMILDKEGRVMLWNKTSEKMLGWTAQEALGKLCPCVPQEKMQDFWELHRQLRADRKFVDLERPCLKKDGQVIETSLILSPLKDDLGGNIGALVFIMDISERKQTEKHLKEKIEEIEKLNKFMMGREKRVLELKREVDEVLKECGKSPKYKA